MSDKTLRLTAEHGTATRKRILLVGLDPFIQDSVSVLLSTMGWGCALVSDVEKILPALQQGSFEAVLLGPARDAADLERTILAIKDVRPSLSERIVLASSGAVESEIQELIERYDLSHLPEEKVLSRLWSTLEDLVALRPWYRVAARNIGVARLLFDSLRMNGPISIRSSYIAGRRFIYEHNNTTIDVLIDVRPGSDRISLIGQVLDETRPQSTYENIAVILVARNGTLARTTTNRLGEFNLQFELAENVSLEIRVAERSWISVPLTKLDWFRERMRKPTGT